MAYRITKQCKCGRTYNYSSKYHDPGTCTVCWKEPDLTEAEAALEDEGKDDS